MTPLLAREMASTVFDGIQRLADELLDIETARFLVEKLEGQPASQFILSISFSRQALSDNLPPFNGGSYSNATGWTRHIYDNISDSL